MISLVQSSSPSLELAAVSTATLNTSTGNTFWVRIQSRRSGCESAAMAAQRTSARTLDSRAAPVRVSRTFQTMSVGDPPEAADAVGEPGSKDASDAVETNWIAAGGRASSGGRPCVTVGGVGGGRSDAAWVVVVSVVVVKSDGDGGCGEIGNG